MAISNPHRAIQQEHVVATAGLTDSLEQMAYVLGDAGDGFLIGRPYYTSLPTDFGSRAGGDKHGCYQLRVSAKQPVGFTQLE